MIPGEPRPTGGPLPTPDRDRLRVRRGALLLEAVVALTILGFILLMGGWVFARRKQLEYERIDRESALLALESEWTVLRAAPASELGPREGAPFVGPQPFLEHIDKRRPRLTLQPGPFEDLMEVRLEISCAPERRVVQVGYVWVRR
jgi:hypothetical protein